MIASGIFGLGRADIGNRGGGNGHVEKSSLESQKVRGRQAKIWVSLKVDEGAALSSYVFENISRCV